MVKFIFLRFILILLLSYLFLTVYGEHKKHGGFSLKMVHWNSPELPSYKPNRTYEELMGELIHISNARVKALKRLTALNTSYSLNDGRPMRPALEAIHGIFLVEVGIGTPSQPNYLALEIGSDWTWTQCQGSSPGFHQRAPLFSWHHSSTYALAPCAQCGGICQSDHCVINLPDGIGGHIKGFAARDTFTFAADHGYRHFTDMDFVCVLQTQGYRATIEDNIESGAFGLGRQGYQKFMRPIHDEHINNDQFSYCLPPLDEPIQGLLFLRFGVDIRLLRARMVTTPILQGPPGSAYYYVELLALSVGGTRLGIDPQVFRLQANGVGGCIIDTSIAMSYIPRVVFDALLSTLSQHFEAKNRRYVAQVPSPFPDLSLCFKQLGHVKPKPVSITFHFAGTASLEVDRSMGVYHHGNSILHCLQILPNDLGLTMIGSLQQANHRFVYDTPRSLLHFTTHNCNHFN